MHLTLTRERKTVLGDYRAPTLQCRAHRISINATLNKYHFLITLLHEMAHLEAWVQYGHRHAPHGREWKDTFRDVLNPLIRRGVFPTDLRSALEQYLSNPAASTCTDPLLYKALHRYNPRRRGYRLVADLPAQQRFETDNGRVYEKMEQLRTRSRCREVDTGKVYFFQGVVEVKVLGEG